MAWTPPRPAQCFAVKRPWHLCSPAAGGAGVLQPLLKPRRSGFELYGGTVPMRALEADARAFSARLAATAAAVLVGSAAVLWRLGALVS